MTCPHTNKTLTAEFGNFDGSAYKVWWCEDCRNTVIETVRVTDLLYKCNGDCAGCHMPIEEGKSCDKG